MKYLRNLALFILGLYLGGYSVFAMSATLPVQYKTTMTGATLFGDTTSACGASWTAYYVASRDCPAGAQYCWTNGGPGLNNTVCTDKCAGSATACPSQCLTGGVCGYGSSISKVCPAGYIVSGTLCVPPEDDPCKSKKGQKFTGSIGPYSSPDAIGGAYASVCAGSCRAVLSQASPKIDKATGQLYVVGSWIYDGTSCTSSDTPANPSNDSTPSDSQPDPETADNPDTKDEDQIDKTCTDNPGGGHTTKYTITHPDGSKDYQYVTLAGKCNGANDTTPEEDFCKNNPDAPKCKNKCADNPTSPECTDRNSSGGSTCDSPPTCDGDAIDCAVLNQAWQIRCEPENQSKKDPLGVLGMQIVSGADPAGGSFPTPANGSTVNVDQQWNASEIYAASCPPDVSFSVSGHNFSLSFGPLCQFGEILGQLNLIFASIGAVYILGRG